MEDGRQNGPIGLLMLADFEQEIKVEYILVTPTEQISTLILVLPFPRHRLNSMKHLCRSIYTCSQVITSNIYMDTDFSYLRINRPSGIPPRKKELYTY